MSGKSINIQYAFSGPQSRVLAETLDGIKLSGAALIYGDIDHFRALNSSLGYVGGDHLIMTAISVLENTFSETLGFCRVGSGFFIIVAEPDLKVVEQLCELVNAELAAIADWSSPQNPQLDASHLVVSLSFGIAWHQPGDQAFFSMAEAESVCRQAKQYGGGRVLIARREARESKCQDNALSQDMRILSEVRDAIKEERLLLFAQAITPLQGGNDLIRHEILLRMKTRDGEIVSPIVFLPAAERYGLIHKVDRYVVSMLFETLRANPELLDRSSGFAVNLSGKTLNDPAFMPFLEAALGEIDFAHKICFEITETEALSELKGTQEFVSRVSRYGCSVSLDDFGSGQCSFGYLRNIPVDNLKIDGGFVRNAANDNTDLQMVKAITDIGHAMGKKVVAEFVSDEVTSILMRAMGVDYAQGYHFDKPKPLTDIAPIGNTITSYLPGIH